MANANSLKNLQPLDTSSEAQSRRGKKGGKASAKKSRLRKAIQQILTMPVQGDTKAKLMALGIPEEECTYEVLMAMQAVTQAIGGDVKAMRFIADSTTLQPAQEERIKVEKEKVKVMKEKISKIDNQPADRENTVADIIAALNDEHASAGMKS